MMTYSAPEGIGGICLDDPVSPVLRAAAADGPRLAAAVPDVTIVIPAYNEAATIADIVRRALAVAPAVIVVDDGSSDGTGSIAQRCGATVLRNPVNSGKGASLWNGMMHALNTGAVDIVT